MWTVLGMKHALQFPDLQSCECMHFTPSVTHQRVNVQQTCADYVVDRGDRCAVPLFEHWCPPGQTYQHCNVLSQHR